MSEIRRYNYSNRIEEGEKDALRAEVAELHRKLDAMDGELRQWEEWRQALIRELEARDE